MDEGELKGVSNRHRNKRKEEKKERQNQRPASSEWLSSRLRQRQPSETKCALQLWHPHYPLCQPTQCLPGQPYHSSLDTHINTRTHTRCAHLHRKTSLLLWLASCYPCSFHHDENECRLLFRAKGIGVPPLSPFFLFRFLFFSLSLVK